MSEITSDDLEEEVGPVPQYLVLPSFKDSPCEIKSRVGVVCGIITPWQIYLKSLWTPCCFMHMHKILKDYRKQRAWEQEDLRKDVVSWRKTAMLPDTEMLNQDREHSQ